jgi:protein-export membrane protein SecD
MKKYRLWSLLIIVSALALTWFVFSSNTEGSRFATKYGLDLSGGSHLVFDADTSSVNPSDIDDAMVSLRNVIERRVNAFGVSEAVVQTEGGGLGSGVDQRLIVEQPGITDVDEAVEMIGKTPTLEFKLVDPQAAAAQAQLQASLNTSTSATSSGVQVEMQDLYTETGLTGAYLKNAQLQFGNGTQYAPAEPVVLVNFNEEGRELFAQITRDNVGQQLAIFLDGEVISTPVIREAIPNGTAVVSGNFIAEEARALVQDLNLGALPVPITLSSVETIGPTLGSAARDAGMLAGIVGFALVALFMIAYYRLPGVVAVVSLLIYLLLMIVLFKIIPVVLTAAGIAGFILSLGMAVDANVLIFERMKEELEANTSDMKAAIREGFSRAWPSIRDGNVSTLISAVILYMVGTSLTKGFALTLGIGVLVSMFSAITLTRTFLLAIAGDVYTKAAQKLYTPGFSGLISSVNKNDK